MAKTNDDASPSPSTKRGENAIAAATALSAQIPQHLRERYSHYWESVGQVHENTAKGYLELVSRLGGNLRKIVQDAAGSDPSVTFAIEVLRAYATQDAKGISDAQRAFANNLQDTHWTAAKGITEALKTVQDEYLALCEESRKSLQSLGEDYSKAVLEAAKNTSPASLDRGSLAMLGHSLLVSAMVMHVTGTRAA